MNKPLFIAEMSANHLGSMDVAIGIIKAAASSGADAVKLQTFTPSQMVGSQDYVINEGPWAGRKLISLYEEAHTPREWHSHLFWLIKELGMTPISSPFHPDDVEFLESLGCAVYKIASFEFTYLDLLESAASTGKQIIASTGMATIKEIDAALDTIFRINPSSDVTLLKCTSAYPSSISDANLSTMADMAERFQCKVGLSDHTLGSTVAKAATALGACAIEKHFTLSRSAGGPDSSFSMEPHEFAEMVNECTAIHSAIGSVSYGAGLAEESSSSMRRSLWFSRDIKKGEIISRDDIKIARPASGLSPAMLYSVIGLASPDDFKSGDAVTSKVLGNV